MHPKLLHDVILRQAGTLSKAGLEGVMNSVDAGGSFCKLTCDGKTLIVEDDGRGFRNKQEIYDWFEVFGQPHEESEGQVIRTLPHGPRAVICLWEKHLDDPGVHYGGGL